VLPTCSIVLNSRGPSGLGASAQPGCAVEGLSFGLTGSVQRRSPAAAPVVSGRVADGGELW